MRTGTRRRATAHFACAIVVGLLAGGMLANRADVAQAWTASSFYLIGIREDSFYNYDSTDQTHSHAYADWPVTLIFTNNAVVEKVKWEVLGPPYEWAGGPMNLWLNDGNGAEWDRDSGRKTHWCPGYGETAYHVRLYADWIDDRLYNVDVGFYVLGSTHEDWQECDNALFGWSHDVEWIVATHAYNKGYRVDYDWWDFYNYEAYRAEGNHFWDNDGWATEVHVP